jgi:hypothetical protein
MDISASTAPRSSLRRPPSSFVPSRSPAIAQEKKKYTAKVKTADPMVVDLTADTYEDEAMPGRKLDSIARMGSPVIVDITSDSGSDESSLSPAPGKTSRVHTIPRAILDRDFHFAHAASKELSSATPTSERTSPPITTVKSPSTPEYRGRSQLKSTDSKLILSLYQDLTDPEDSTNLRPLKQD